MQINLCKIFFTQFTLLFLSLGAAAAEQPIVQESEPSTLWYHPDAFENLPKAFEHYKTICNQLGATENPKIPDKGTNIARIATYNVHFWQSPVKKYRDARDDYTFNQILKTIQFVNADILILQEVGDLQHRRSDLNALMKSKGYLYSNSCSTGPLANFIFSKFPLSNVVKKTYKNNPSDKNEEKRCFVRAIVDLPNNNKISVYGTHLEVRSLDKTDPEVIRLEQFKELVAYINQHDQGNNVVIGLDSNTVRQSDFLYKIGSTSAWDLYRDVNKKILNKSIEPKALDYLASQGYKDSFEMLDIIAPKFTSLYGSRIDFLLLNPGWNLPLVGSYVFYSWASDHIPVIMDIDVSNAATEKPAGSNNGIDSFAQTLSAIG